VGQQLALTILGGVCRLERAQTPTVVDVNIRATLGHALITSS
jgi:hypothetical protein